jgi:hypothetical protein
VAISRRTCRVDTDASDGADNAKLAIVTRSQKATLTKSGGSIQAQVSAENGMELALAPLRASAQGRCRRTMIDVEELVYWAVILCVVIVLGIRKRKTK